MPGSVNAGNVHAYAAHLHTPGGAFSHTQVAFLHQLIFRLNFNWLYLYPPILVHNPAPFPTIHGHPFSQILD